MFNIRGLAREEAPVSSSEHLPPSVYAAISETCREGSGTFTAAARMDPSLAVIDTTALPEAAAGLTSPQTTTLVGSLLVTSGDGGVALLYRRDMSAVGDPPLAPSLPSSHSGMLQTETVFPLRSLPPLAGHRPLVIEAAYALSSGERCMLLGEREGAGPILRSAAHPVWSSHA
jgi:hypothetical protein